MGGDGVILFVPASSGFQRVSATGGAVQVVGDTALVSGTTDRWPHFLPDGRHFLFLRRTPGAKPTIYLSALDDPQTREIIEVSSRAEYADGRLYFVRDAALFAQSFDLKTFTLNGEAVRVADGVGVGGADHRNSAFSVAAGHVVTWSGTGSPMARLLLVDARGRVLRQVGPQASYIDMDLEPGGRRVAVELGDPRTSMPGTWLVDIASGQTSVLAAPTEGAGTPRWIPGTTDLIYSTFTANTQVRQSTTSPESRTYKSLTAWISDVTPDGKFSVFQASRRGSGEDVLLLSLDDGGDPIPHLDAPIIERSPVVSPDGQWLAYTSNESGRSEVLVEAFPGRANRQVVSSGGGYQPQWSADGRVLYFITGDTSLVAAAVSRNGTSLAFARRTLFRLDRLYSLDDARQTYQPLPDGNFLLSVLSDSTPSAYLRVGLNWAER